MQHSLIETGYKILKCKDEYNEKNKIWDKYILDKNNYKIKNGIIKPGTYKVVFTENELNNINSDNIYINFLIRKNGEEIYNYQINNI